MLEHNPYKGDSYSLGIVLIGLATITAQVKASSLERHFKGLWVFRDETQFAEERQAQIL